MSTAVALSPVLPRPRRRRPLGELDPNRDLNAPRGLAKRAPITFEQENESTVLNGLQLGIYIADEVIAWTNYRGSHISAPGRGASEPDGNEPSTRALGDAFQDDGLSEEEAAEDIDEEDFEEEVDDEAEAELGEHDDELLGEVMDEDLCEEHEHDEQVDPDEQLHGSVFDPAAIGLKEINNLAHFGVSSHKPGNGVEELLSDDLDKYWQ